MSDETEFRKKFSYDPSLAGYIGVEREFFIVDAQSGRHTPRSACLLQALPTEVKNTGWFGPELSACQVESKTIPVKTVAVMISRQKVLTGLLQDSASSLGLKLVTDEVAPQDMSLEVFKDSEGRYQRLANEMPETVLSAACRVIGTHIHIGMPNHEMALATYNKVVAESDTLTVLGDNSCGRRLEQYRVVARDCVPKQHASWAEFASHAASAGYYDDPRNCWNLIRLTRYGTIEFRNFGATSNLEQLALWAETCQSLCM